MGWRHPVVKEANRLIKRIKRILEEADKARKAMDNTHIKAVLRAAEELGIGERKSIHSLRKLLSSTNLKTLDKMIRKALKRGDQACALKVMVLKRQATLKKSTMVDWTKYKGLKLDISWASEKYWGDKEIRCARMTVFQREVIHSPLTDIYVNGNQERGDHVKAKVLAGFSTIQTFMGQRDASHLPSDLFELLRGCIKYPEMRTEIYIGLLKQMTKNPDFNAVRRAWNLMALFLTVFPPSPDFEDFLGNFLNAEDMSSDLHCFGLLVQRCFEGEVKPLDVPRFYQGYSIKRILEERTPTWLTQVEEVESGDHDPSAYKDLLVEFYDKGFEHVENLKKQGKKKTKAAKSEGNGDTLLLTHVKESNKNGDGVHQKKSKKKSKKDKKGKKGKEKAAKGT